MSGSSSVGTTSVPAPTMTDAGFVSPAESDILAGILEDMNAAFGNVLNTDLSTPQGQLAIEAQGQERECNRAVQAQDTHSAARTNWRRTACGGGANWPL